MREALKKPVYLEIETLEELELLKKILAISYDMNNDDVLDDAVLSVSQTRDIGGMTDAYAEAALNKSRTATNENINRLLISAKLHERIKRLDYSTVLTK